MSAAGRIVRNSSFQLADAVVSGILGLIMTGVLARYLGPQGYGQYALVMAIVPLFQFVSEWGVDQVALREISRSRAEAGRIIANTVLLKVGPSLAAVALCWLALSFSGYSAEVTAAARIYSLFLLAHVIGPVSLAFTADLRSEYLVFSDILATALNFLLLLAVVQLSGGLPSIFVAALVAVTVRETLGLYFARRYVAIDFRLDRALCRRLLSQTPTFGVTRLLISLSGSITLLLLSKLGTDEALGLYGAAARIPVMLVYVPTILTASLFPLLAARYASDRAGLRRLYVRGMELVLMVALPAVVGGWLVADQLIGALFGGKFSAAVPVFQWLMVQWLCLSVGMLVSQTLVAVDGERLAAWLSAFIVGGLLIGGLIAIPAGGALGAAVAASVVYALAMVVGLIVLARRMGGFAWSWTMPRVLLAVGVLVPMLVATRTLSVFLVIPLTVLLYGAALLAVRAVSLTELRLALSTAGRQSGMQ